MTVLGLIPARGGSKRVPGKNMRMLGGKPLVAWTIEAALCSGMLDQVVVSTDDDEIARIAEDWGCPWVRRPSWLAGDSASSYDVVRYTIKREFSDLCGHVMLLQPTSPFRTAGDIDHFGIGTYPRMWASYAAGSVKLNGAIYCAPTDYWRWREFNFDTYSEMSRIEMPLERSLDIDTEADFAKAEAMVAQWAA